MSQAKLDALKPLLIKLYHRADTPREFGLVRVLWIVLGLGDPL